MAGQAPGPGLARDLLNAIVCKVRDQYTVKNRAAHLAVGVGIDGKKDLGIWVEHTPAGRSKRRREAAADNGVTYNTLIEQPREKPSQTARMRCV